MSKLDYIDLMKLQASGSANGWNEFLTDCLRGCMVNKIADVRVRLQRGMAKLAKDKLNTPDMIAFFIRLSKSLDDTERKIIRKLDPNFHDDSRNKTKDEKQLKKKRERDAALEAHRKKTSY